MPNPNPPSRRARAEAHVQQRLQELLAQAPPLSEEMRRELRPLLLAENVTTTRGVARGRQDGKGRWRGY